MMGKPFQMVVTFINLILLGFASMEIIKINMIFVFKMCRLFEANYISMKPLQKKKFKE